MQNQLHSQFQVTLICAYMISNFSSLSPLSCFAREFIRYFLCSRHAQDNRVNDARIALEE